jgi:hypothetical protein
MEQKTGKHRSSFLYAALTLWNLRPLRKQDKVPVYGGELGNALNDVGRYVTRFPVVAKWMEFTRQGIFGQHNPRHPWFSSYPRKCSFQSNYFQSVRNKYDIKESVKLSFEQQFPLPCKQNTKFL